MPINDLNQLNLGRPSTPKAPASSVNISDIRIAPRKSKAAPAPKISDSDIETLHGDWVSDPTDVNLNSLLASLKPQIARSISALVAKPTAAVNSKARLLAIKAIKSYNPKGGAKLTTWVFNQLQPLKRYTQQAAPVAVSERMFRHQAELFKFEDSFYDNHNRYPSDRELADIMNISKTQIAKIRMFNRASVHELQQFGSDPETSATASEITGTHPDKVEEIIDLFYDSLGPSEQTILEYRLGLRGRKALPNSAVALKVGLSPARVSQIANELADRLDEFKETSEGVL